jgi:2-oxoglutarate ferredoxin oxidoreductase subunit alpha
VDGLDSKLSGGPRLIADYMRVRGFPFGESVRAFIEEHDVCYVVEQNRDAQLRSLLLIETGVAPEKLKSVLVYGGFPLSAQRVVEGITGVESTPRPVASPPLSPSTGEGE